MGLVDGHKAKAGYRCTVTGREAHSAYPALGANAVVAAARIIAEVAAMGERFAARRAVRGRVRPAAPHRRRRPDRGRLAAQHHPQSLQLRVRVPHPAGEDPLRFVRRIEAFAQERVLPGLRATAPDADIAFEEVLAYPGMTPAAESDFARLCRELTGTREPAKVAFGTEGGCFAARGIPALVCGPGDINVAHKPDEWIARRAARAVRRISARARASSPDVDLSLRARHGTAGPLVRNVTRRPRHRRYLGVRHLTARLDGFHSAAAGCRWSAKGSHGDGLLHAATATPKLAAIFSADVAGYVRLMEQDEVWTLRRLTEHRALLAGLITAHGGRIANMAGDGLLAEFPSAVNAVECAVARTAAYRRSGRRAAGRSAGWGSGSASMSATSCCRRAICSARA